MNEGTERQDTRADLREYFRICHMTMGRAPHRPPGSKRIQAMRENKPGAGRYFHISAHVSMRSDPRGATFPKIPTIAKPGKTYNVGRNAAKRAQRELRA